MKDAGYLRRLEYLWCGIVVKALDATPKALKCLQ